MTEKRAKEYLQVIYALQKDGAVKGVSIAKEMGITKPSVCVFLRQLVEDGYLNREPDRSVTLTSKGMLLAKTAIHETISRGQSYNSLINGIEPVHVKHVKNGEPETMLERLKTEGTQSVLEAIFILSKKYFCVRSVDVARFLKKKTSDIKHKTQKLEEYGLISIEEGIALVLTKKGSQYAQTIYNEHSEMRGKLKDTGLPEETAEAVACKIVQGV